MYNTSSNNTNQGGGGGGSSSYPHPGGPLSPNSAELIAMLQGAGGMNMTPPVEGELDSNVFAGVGGGDAGNKQGNGMFGMDSFMLYGGTTMGNSVGFGGAGQNVWKQQVSLNMLGGGSYPTYGVSTPEGSTTASTGRRNVSGDSGPSNSASPENAAGAVASSSLSFGPGSNVETKNVNPTRKSSGGRGTIKRDTSGAESSAQAQQHQKRKADDVDARRREEEDEDMSSDDEAPAASRRTNKAATSASASSRRKSGNVAQSANGTPGASSSVGGDSKTDVSKAIKRKEQNRAAQKAFRERREQRVKDLEDKVRELEEQSMGQSVENENLRQLLQKLQQENRALMQNAFSFKGPMPTMSDLNAGNLQVLQSNPAASSMEPPLQTIKPPSPPISVRDGRKDSSTSTNSNNGRPSLSGGIGHSSSSPGNMADMTPASTVSKSSTASSPPGRQASSGSAGGFFNPDPYNAFSGGAFAAAGDDGSLPPAYGMAPRQSSSTSTSPTFPVASGSAAMAPPATTRTQQQSQSWIQASSSSDSAANNLANATPFTILSFNPAFTSFRDDTPFGNIGGLGLGQFDYRESKQANVGVTDNDMDDPFAGLDGMGDDAMDAFLRSLSDGTSTVDPGPQAAVGQTSFSVTADGMHVMNPEHSKYYIPPGADAMDTGSDLLEAYLRDGFSAEVNEKWALNAARMQSGGSISSSNGNVGAGLGGGSSGNLLSPNSGTSNSGFSPSNYFTLSPEATPSTVPSSISRHDSTSSSNSPGGVMKKSTPLAIGTMGPSEPCEEQKVMGKNGKLLSPAEVWSKFQERLDFSEGLDIDDLCSELKAKAVCGGVGPAVPESALDKALDEYAAQKRAAAAAAGGR